MNKTIERIENYKEKTLNTAIEKLQRDRKEARDNLNATGYDRYYNKMERCEKEIDELMAYRERDSAISAAEREKALAKQELDRIKKDIKNKVFYLLADFPECTEARNLREYVDNL